MDKFDEVIPTGPKVIGPNTLNFGHLLNLYLPCVFFGGYPNFGPNFYSCTYFLQFGKVLQRSAEGARRFRLFRLFFFVTKAIAPNFWERLLKFWDLLCLCGHIPIMF